MSGPALTGRRERRAAARPRRRGAWLLAAALLAAPGRASADPCPAPGRPFVGVDVEVLPPDLIIATTLVTHLRAELAGRRIDVCEAPSTPGPVARVKLHVRRDGAGAVVAVIALEDRLLRKEVSREIDLTPLPADVRPTTVATAADELLRAAWAELVLVDAPPSSPPAEVVEAVRSTQRAPASSLAGGAFAQASLAAHRASLGGGLLGQTWLGPRVGLIGVLEASRGLPRDATHGQARLDTLSLGLGPTIALSAPERAGVRLESLALATLALPDGEPAAGATSRQGATGTVELSAGARAWLPAGPLVVTAALAARYTLRPVRATDEGALVTSLEGLAGTLSLGVALAR